jgi:2,3-dihydroxybiphenyl 1,2-dioxygenase
MHAGVSQLAYLRLRVADLAAWEAFSVGVLGAGVRRAADDKTLQLRLDERAFRIELQAGEAEALTQVGWEVPSEAAYESVLARLAVHGVEVVEHPPAVNEARSFSRTAAFVDPCGVPSEIAFGPVIGTQEFMPSVPMSGFVAGSLGFGHLFMYVDDISVAADFYCDVLGLRISDYITWPEADIDAVFLRCNPRHHSVAFATSTGASPRTLEHFMLETRSVDDVGRALDAVGSPAGLFSTLGRHTNDRMLSFYARTPSGFLVEYGCDALQVAEEDWAIKRYTNGHTWGHSRIGPGPQLLPFASEVTAAVAGGASDSSVEATAAS